jgi:hypothetical protein
MQMTTLSVLPLYNPRDLNSGRPRRGFSAIVGL